MAEEVKQDVRRQGQTP